MEEEPEDQEEAGGLRMPDEAVDPIAEDEDGSKSEEVEQIASAPKPIKQKFQRSESPVASSDRQQPSPQQIQSMGVPSIPERPKQQLQYGSKKAIAKDKVGIGCLLEAVGIFIFFTTIFTIIGPLVGLALFACGYSIARQKRYVCRNCGNELAPESKLCPTCEAVYKSGLLQFLLRLPAFILFLGLVAIVIAYATGNKEEVKSLLEFWKSDAEAEVAKDAHEQANTLPKTTDPVTTLPEIEPIDLILQRDWTDLQGRVVRASLIDALKRPDGSYYGKFRKPDGSEFEYDVLKLSKPDRALIKQALVKEGRIPE